MPDGANPFVVLAFESGYATARDLAAWLFFPDISKIRDTSNDIQFYRASKTLCTLSTD